MTYPRVLGPAHTTPVGDGPHGPSLGPPPEHTAHVRTTSDTVRVKYSLVNMWAVCRLYIILIEICLDASMA